MALLCSITWFRFQPLFLYPLGRYKHDRGVFAISEFEKSTQLFVVIPNIVSNFAPVICDNIVHVCGMSANRYIEECLWPPSQTIPEP